MGSNGYLLVCAKCLQRALSPLVGQGSVLLVATGLVLRAVVSVAMQPRSTGLPVKYKIFDTFDTYILRVLDTKQYLENKVTRVRQNF